MAASAASERRLSVANGGTHNGGVANHSKRQRELLPLQTSSSLKTGKSSDSLLGEQGAVV